MKGLALAVAEVLSGERAAQRLTLQQVSDRSGVPLRTLKRYIPARGMPSREMSLGTIEQVAESMDLTLRQVLDAASGRLLRTEEAKRRGDAV